MTFLCKAHTADVTNNIYNGWYMSRKFNGFSMLWDGGITTGKTIGQAKNLCNDFKPRKREDNYTLCTGLWTSDGHIIHAPSWWYNNLPKYIPLQGECWYNDSKWYSSICNSTYKNSVYDSRWNSLEFVVYNYKPYCLFGGVSVDSLPENKQIYFENLIFSRRNELIHYAFTTHTLVKQEFIHKDLNLNQYLQEMTAGTNSYEGIMLANPAALYESKRTYGLLKIKPEYDIEVEVTGFNFGTGKHSNRMGSLRVALTWDEKVLSFHGGKKEFIGKTVFFNVGVGFSDEQRELDYIAEYFYDKIITIYFNEVGEQGSIPTARWRNDAK